MAAHRYWRVYVTRVQNHGNTTFSAVEFRGAVGGANLATGGTALSSGDFSGRPASNAFDTNPATIWSSAGVAPNWIGYDFGSAVSIAEVALTLQNDATFYDQAPLDCLVQSSDDASAWATEWSHTAMANWTNAETRALRRPVFNTPHLHWRVYCQNAQNGGAFAAFAEVEMRGVAGGADQCAGGTPSADSNFDGSTVVANGFDNSTATAWSSASGFPHWIAYQFASATSVVELALTARNDATYYAQAPSAFILQSCDDGKAWADEETYSGVSWTGAAQQKVFTLTDALRSSKAVTYAAVGTIPDVESVSKALSYAATGPGQDTTVSTTKALSYGALGPGYPGTLACTKAVTYAVLGPGGVSQQRITVALVCRARQAA